VSDPAHTQAPGVATPGRTGRALDRAVAVVGDGRPARGARNTDRVVLDERAGGVTGHGDKVKRSLRADRGEVTMAPRRGRPRARLREHALGWCGTRRPAGAIGRTAARRGSCNRRDTAEAQGAAPPRRRPISMAVARPVAAEPDARPEAPDNGHFLGATSARAFWSGDSCLSPLSPQTRARRFGYTVPRCVLTCGEIL